NLELGGSPVEVTAATSSTLKVTIPEGVSSGRFVIRNRNGAAASIGEFIVPTALTVSPEAPEIVVGGKLQFGTEVVSSASNQVVWKVNDTIGGNNSIGLITAEGLYTAPLAIPPGGVTISASLLSDPSITSSTQVTILPPPSRPGKATILASVGGKVRSTDESATLDIPAGALSSNKEITVEVLRGSSAPPP